MEPGYLIDTNVIIDNFGNKLPEKAKKLLYSIYLTISAVTKLVVISRNASDFKNIQGLKVIDPYS
jgi:predicted nucleic acid-binding protein